MRSRLAILATLIILLLNFAPVPAQADPATDILNACSLAPDACVPIAGDLISGDPALVVSMNNISIGAPDGADTTSATDGAAQILSGHVIDSYHWRYDHLVHLYLCHLSSGDCVERGQVKVWAKINLNGRQSQWTQYSRTWSGPAVRTTHSYNCVDDNGGLPNSSCSGGWQQLQNSVYTTGAYTNPNPDYNYHSDDDLYWYNFRWTIKVSGDGTWNWPNSGNFTSTKFDCNSIWGECRFQ